MTFIGRLCSLLQRVFGGAPEWWVLFSQYLLSLNVPAVSTSKIVTVNDPDPITLAYFVEQDADYLLFIAPGATVKPILQKVLQQAVSDHPEADFFYWDHLQKGVVSNDQALCLKTAWDFDQWLHNDFVQGCCLVSVASIKRAGEVSSWREMLWRLAVNNPNNIVHVPWVLHRVHRSALQANADEHLRFLAPRLLVEDAENRAGFAEKVDQDGLHLHWRWALPKNTYHVSIVIPTRNQSALVKQCVDAILEKTTYPHYEIVLVDNQSDQAEALEYFASLADHPCVRVLEHHEPFNFSRINNFAISQANGNVICLLNNDTEVIDHDWLQQMLQQLHRPGVGMVGAKLLFDDNSIQHAGVVLGVWGGACHGHRTAAEHAGGHMGRLDIVQQYSALTAACVMFRRDHFFAYGPMDEALQVAFNDVDLCLRFKAVGLRNIWTPWARLFHYESKSRGALDTSAKRERELAEVNLLRARWGVDQAVDPSYHPWLSHLSDDFSYAWWPQSLLSRTQQSPYLMDSKTTR